MAMLTTSGPTVTHEREDLSPVITRIDPAEVPFYSNCRKGRASAIKHEWTVQELNAVNDDNAAPEGWDATFEDLKIPDRFENPTQIVYRDGKVTGTYDSVDTLGQQTETARQKVLRGLEIRRDVESIVTKNQIGDMTAAAVAPYTGVSRNMAGFPTWTSGNVSLGATSTPGTGDGKTLLVPGTTRPFDTADYLDVVMELAYDEGGQPRAIYMRPRTKRRFSELPDAWAPGTAHRVNATRPAELTYVGAVDAYVTDFGTIQSVVSRFMHANTALSDEYIFAIDPRYISINTLPGRNFVAEDLAKTGDSSPFQILWEGTLEASAPKAHGLVGALNVT